MTPGQVHGFIWWFERTQGGVMAGQNREYSIEIENLFGTPAPTSNGDMAAALSTINGIIFASQLEQRPMTCETMDGRAAAHLRADLEANGFSKSDTATIGCMWIRVYRVERLIYSVYTNRQGYQGTFVADSNGIIGRTLGPR